MLEQLLVELASNYVIFLSLYVFLPTTQENTMQYMLLIATSEAVEAAAPGQRRRALRERQRVL